MKITNLKTIINKKILLLLILLVFIYTYYTVPSYLELGGGSCNQGIAAGISKLFLIISFIINLISLIFLNYDGGIKTGKTLSIISISIWSISGLMLIQKEIFRGLIYFFPYFSVTLLLILYSFKWRDKEIE